VLGQPSSLRPHWLQERTQNLHNFRGREWLRWVLNESGKRHLNLCKHTKDRFRRWKKMEAIDLSCHLLAILLFVNLLMPYARIICPVKLSSTNEQVTHLWIASRDFPLTFSSLSFHVL
jgi:hypothetical protein